MIRRFKVRHTDDYRSGPKLHIVQEYDEDDGDIDEDEDDDDVNAYDIEFCLENDKYHVFHLRNANTKLLQCFTNKDSAILYAKHQYKLFTGDFPFIETGMTSAYHPTGDRPKFDVEEEEICYIEEGNIGKGGNEIEIGDDYIIILNNKEFESHSLNPFAIW